MSTRQEMIDKLVEDDIKFIKRSLQNGFTEYLAQILEHGVPYREWTDAQIETEFLERTWEF
jgi:hypothetical protein